MSAELIEEWLRSGRPAIIEGRTLRPIENARHKGTPLCVARCQAESYFLTDPHGAGWILKKFRQRLDELYLADVSKVLPRHEGFSCGTERHVLKNGSLTTSKGSYAGRQFKEWLNGTILMPKVEGVAWADLADELRNEDRILSRSERLRLCRNLSDLIRHLEQAECVHRDLSSGNVFICTKSGRVFLIDFDSLFHPCLTMPSATTSGTEGYIAPYVWYGGRANPMSTWCPKADRFALALLNIELLMMAGDSPFSADGGLFDQRELAVRRGRQLDATGKRLKVEFPGAYTLLDSCMRSNDFVDCPSPDAWIRYCDAAEKTSIPSLCDLELIGLDYFQGALNRRGKLRGTSAAMTTTVSLPDNPWRN